MNCISDDWKPFEVGSTSSSTDWEDFNAVSHYIELETTRLGEGSIANIRFNLNLLLGIGAGTKADGVVKFLRE